jgi:hypothetical protein
MTRVEILNAAMKATNGDRDKKHGRPEDSFAMIGQLWEAYTGRMFSSVDVAIMLGLLKVARIKTGTGDMDSFVDLAGYAACAGELQARVNELAEG